MIPLALVFLAGFGVLIHPFFRLVFRVKFSFAVSYPSAFLTAASAVGQHFHVRLFEMAPGTMILSSIFRRITDTAKDVDLWSNDLNMRGIHTPTVSAQMITMQTEPDRGNEMFVSPTMSANVSLSSVGSASDTKACIAAGEMTPKPFPTAGRRDVDFRHEAVVVRLSFCSWHKDKHTTNGRVQSSRKN